MDQKLTHAISLTELQRIKKWHVAHRSDHPLEYQLWDAVLTVWIMGWIGWLPAYALGAWWATPLCVLAMLSPRLYVYWRQQAHETQRLRCDWLDCVG
ncbi:MAG: hypothetical protein RIS34_619 [Pseudomonadota bacterium]